MFARRLTIALALFATVGPFAARRAEACAANEVSFGGNCFYLDGTGGVCNFGGARATNAQLDAIIANNPNAWQNLNYRSTVSTNCCVWTQDASEKYGMVTHCNSAGPFAAGEPAVNGAGCNGAMQFQVGTPGQLTLCVYASSVPQIAASPVSVNFGNQRVGTTSATQNITLTNTGTANLVINSFSKAGPYNVANLNPVTLVPGGQTTFQVSFSPTVVGVVNGSVTVNSNAANAPNLNIPLSGNGVVSTLNLNPMTINFGNQTVNTVSAGSNVTITNTGQAVLNITGSSVTGPFQVSGLVNGPIAPNGTLVFTVKFAPTVAGNAAGNVKITSDDPNSPATLTLSGVGTAPSIAAAPNPVNFGTQALGGGGASQNVVLTSTGNAPLTINAATISGMAQADYTITLIMPNLPATLPQNSTATVTVLFKPTSVGARNATLVITSNAFNMGTLNVPLVGTGSGPQISVAPNPLDFGTANVNAPVMLPLTVKNTGDMSLTVQNYTFGGPNGADFTSNTQVPFTLAPNASMPINVTMKASAAGNRMATITVASTDPINPATIVNLVGVATAPMIAFDQNALTFPDTLVNTMAAPQMLTVTNNGNGPLTISAIALGGPDAAQFGFAAGQLPVTLQPGANKAWAVGFNPTMVGMFNGTLTFVSDDPMSPNATVNLSGNGVSPMIAVSPMTVDFGAQLVGHTSQGRDVTIKNTGTASLTITQLNISGPQMAAFAEVNPPGLPSSLSAGASEPITITLTPAAVGADTATLVIQSDDPNTPQVKVKLTGSGVSSVLAASPMTLDFGVVKAPGKAMDKMITITNSGGDPITMLDASVTGMNASAFTVDSAAGTLMPGEMKQFAAHFTAASAGDFSATANFAAMEMGIPAATVMMTGKGVSALIVAMPSTLDFGTVDVGTTSPTQKVTVTNQSASPVRLMSVTPDDPTFLVMNANTASDIDAGTSSTFDVAFMPSAVGAKSGKINITLMGGTGPEQVVMAMGTGKAASPDMGGGGGNNGGGCNCAVGAPRHAAGGAALFALVVAALLLRRRRR